ncbi:MAG: hypothetical protein HZB86_09885 [Deltaproteobacteria bacterium]|nr:hypothetical protein [Deltaproteobacteria bacterium]
MGTARGLRPDLAARLREIDRRLARRFGEPDLCGHETSPVRNLVLTILSQNTTDANRDRAFDALMRRFPRTMPLPEARAYLTSFRGVGVKTANILLLFSFGLPAFPVDTHILRVTKRLGLVPATADLAKAALAIEPHVPPGKPMRLHLNLIRLGREVCRPRNPLCLECPLLAVCPEGKRNTKALAMGGSGAAQPEGKGRIA